jgi:hypothetical protein
MKRAHLDTLEEKKINLTSLIKIIIEYISSSFLMKMSEIRTAKILNTQKNK